MQMVMLTCLLRRQQSNPLGQERPFLSEIIPPYWSFSSFTRILIAKISVPHPRAQEQYYEAACLEYQECKTAAGT